MFGNPGTTELPLMDGLAREPGIRYVLALQEAVAISMADAYAQAQRRARRGETCTCRPGSGNAMGMLYDAYKAHSPLLLTAGQHDQSFHGHGADPLVRSAAGGHALREVGDGGAPARGPAAHRAPRGEDGARSAERSGLPLAALWTSSTPSATTWIS